MSLIEKIDAEIAKLGNRIEQYENGNKMAYGISVGLEKAKKIIISEQKEPCNKQVQCRYSETGCGDCEYTKSLSKPLTIGDKIRESNESLAKFIETITDKCIRGKCLECQLYKACDREDNAKDIEDYLNQPYTE